MWTLHSRRRFLAGISLAGAAGLVGVSKPLHAEPPPETVSVRLPVFYKISDCQIPEYEAGELLRAEGFTDVRLVDSGTGLDSADWLAKGELDFDWNYPTTYARSIEAGAQITVLAGLHVGCLELFARDGINSIADLKGKRVGIFAQTSAPHVLVILLASYVGLDPFRDIEWVENEKTSPKDLFVDGKIDAFLAQPPEPQELRARKIGHAILKTAADKPWSQYFCCMLAGATDYVSKYPVATKRVLRALLKSVDLCVSAPEQAVRRAVDDGYSDSYEYALQAMTDARYDKWREYDSEDTLRFYALRMEEAGLLKSDPQKIIANGTDWRFINELKRELKT
jgi:NitT/TauT family transport system substrate-binding protein